MKPHPARAYPHPVNFYREVYDTNNPYRYYNSLTVLSYDWLKSDQSDTLEALQSIFNSRSVNGISKNIYLYSPDELHNQWLSPVDVHYVETRDGTLRGLSFIRFNQENGIPDDLELDGLNIFLTDGKSIVVRVPDVNNSSYIYIVKIPPSRPHSNSPRHSAGHHRSVGVQEALMRCQLLGRPPMILQFDCPE